MQLKMGKVIKKKIGVYDFRFRYVNNRKGYGEYSPAGISVYGRNLKHINDCVEYDMKYLSDTFNALERYYYLYKDKNIQVKFEFSHREDILLKVINIETQEYKSITKEYYDFEITFENNTKIERKDNIELYDYIIYNIFYFP